MFSPLVYSSDFISYVAMLSLVNIAWFLLKKGKEGYLNFYTIFFFSFWLVNFFYPLILYPLDPQYFSVFTIDFNSDVISKSTALAWVAGSSFIWGASRKIKIGKDVNEIVHYSHLLPTFVTLFLLFVFLFTVGSEFLMGAFDSHSPLSLYVLHLLTCSVLLATILFFRCFAYQRQKLIFILVVSLYVILFLKVGDRGPALSIMIVSIVLYSNYVRKINLYYILPMAFLGLILMHLIGEGRSHSVVLENSSIISRGLEKFQFNFDSYLNLTHSFVVNNWTLYFGVDYVDKHGLNYGLTIIKPILGVFPFLLGGLESIFGLTLNTSAAFITESVLGVDASWGLGTNLIVDVYMSFGFFGVVLLFSLFGWVVERSRVIAIVNNTVISSIIYFSLVSYALYMPRTSLFMPLRFIIWMGIIYLILRLIMRPIKKKVL